MGTGKKYSGVTAWQGGIIAGILFVLASCSEQIDWDLKYEALDVIVVEGKITTEAVAHEVSLSHPVYEMNAEARAVRGAVVEVFDGLELHPFSEDPLRPGIYMADPPFAAEVNKGYQLRVNHGGKRIRAVSFTEPVTDFQNMSVYRVQEDPVLLEAYISDSDRPAIVRAELDWSHVEGYDTLPVGETHAVIYHYTVGGVDVNRMFSPARERVHFPPGTIVFLEKEAVPPAYAVFLRGILSETDWRGGVFDVLPGNAATNLEGDALGYFTACEVIRDTIRDIRNMP